MKTSVRAFSLLSAVIALVISCAAAPTFAQALATLAGTITDPHGASIPDAQIEAERVPAAGPLERVRSGGDGRFVMQLPPGTYRVTVSHDSFSKTGQEITLTPGETRELPVRMRLEPLSAKVIVTAQAIPVEAASSAAPVDILTSQDIARREAASLPDLLATLPGFSLGRNNAEGGLTSLFLDGGNSSYTKVLVDGAPVNQPGGIVNFSNLTLDNVEKIEVVHGAESAIYGSDAMDGVIQIFTRRGATRVPVFSVFGEGGNFSSGRGGGELSGLLGRFDYSAGAAYFDTSGQGPNDAFRNRTLSGNFGWRFSDTARVSLALRDNVSAAGTPGQTLLVPPNLQDGTGLHNFSSSLRAEFTTGSHWTHQLTGAESYNRELDYDPFFTTFLQYNRADLLAESTYLARGVGLTAGYQYEVENGFLSYIALHVRRNNQAGFLELRWQPVTRLTLSAGARAEDNADFGTRVVPRAGIAYTVRTAQGAFGDTRLRASYGQGIKEPRFDQSFGSDPCFPGNPDLLPEQSRTVHAGVEQKLASDRARITVDYFDNRFRDIVSFQSVTPPPACLAIGAPFGAGTFFNTNLARARGANISGEARFTRWLTARANYTYDSTRVLSAPNNFDPNYIPGSRLLRRPVHSGNLVLNAAFRRMNWNLAGYFTGRRADSDFLGLGLTSNPGYARFDFAGSYSLTHGVSVYGRVVNLADRQYQEVLGFPALGREFRLGVRYTTRGE
jgi:vitamin B12 transporter